MELTQIMNKDLSELKKYEGYVLKMKYAYEFRNFSEYITVIGYVKEFSEKYKHLFFGHPYDVDKKIMTSGEMGLRYEVDDFEFYPITDEEFELWKEEYQKFHKMILHEKGYDSCEEDIKKVKIYK